MKSNAGQTHEALARGHDVKMGSERGFGVVFAVVFALIGVWPAVHLGWAPRFDAEALRWWSLAIAAAFLAVALTVPSVLRPLNRLWFQFGMLLSKVMTPIVMGILFVTTVVPTALIMRRKDPLRLKLDRQAKSYWIMREPPGPARDTMGNQY
jgi:Saxitoxin biosynthesis operon protein SxtJ